MIKPKVAIVSPVHIQPSEEWIKSLERVGSGHKIIIVDDSNGIVVMPNSFDVYDYQRQEEAMGTKLYKKFEKFHKSAACKNFGTWLAYKLEYDVVIVIDSDCIVPPDLISKHLQALDVIAHGWQNPLFDTRVFARGFPYHERERTVVSNVGLWSNALDLYGADRIGQDDLPREPILYRDSEIAHGIIPYSGMNIAIRREAIPALLFLPNFDMAEYKFRRHDDIWGGYIFQKLAQKMQHKLTFGLPIVYHDSIVIPEDDAKEEVAMIAHEEDFFSVVDYAMARVEQGSYQKMFASFAEEALRTKDPLLSKIHPALMFWKQAFE